MSFQTSGHAKFKTNLLVKLFFFDRETNSNSTVNFTSFLKLFYFPEQ